jgi:hypothetical protein
MPKRIQRQRAKGWKAPPGCVYVGRPTIFGNTFPIMQMGDGWWVMSRDFETGTARFDTEAEARLGACLCYRGNLSEVLKHLARTRLRGKDLACWCPLDQACHADVLLEIANVPA